MKDKNGNDILAVIPQEVMVRVSLIRNSKSIRMFMYIAGKIIAMQNEMCEDLGLKQNYADLERGYNELYKANLVMRYIDEHRNIIYSLHPSYIADNLECQTCNLSRRKILRTKRKNIKYFACTATFNCTYNYFRVALTVFRQYKLMNGLEPHENSGSVKRSACETERRLDEDVEKWNSDSFVIFMAQKYKENYSHMDNPTKPALRVTVSKIRKILSEEFPDTWRRLLKHYLIHEFERATSEKRYLIHKYLTGIKGLLDYANHNHTFDMEECEKYKIYCSYWKCGECILK